METKKSKKADLENKKRLFLQIGIGITLLAVLFAFDIKQYERTGIDLKTYDLHLFEEDDIPIIRPEQPPPPPPPETSHEFIVVDDKVEIEEILNIDVTAILDEPIPDYRHFYFIEKDDPDSIFIIVEEKPKFPGGQKALNRYLKDNIRYPALASETGIQGTVFVTFVVEHDGSITNVELYRGIGGGCDQEAVRVVKNMPDWYPGKQRFNPVRVQFFIPVRFVLN